ncbi:MAG: ribonuclease III family protein [Candidatus Heimdallarchaeota archaeon]
MDSFQHTLRTFISEETDFKHILTDKNLAKFGDSLINFIYSIAKSVVVGVFCGEKVSDKALASALSETPLKNKTRPRSTVNEQADAVEAFCAYLWFIQLSSLEEMVTIIANVIKGQDLSYHKTEKTAQKQAFKKLIELLLEKTDLR